MLGMVTDNLMEVDWDKIGEDKINQVKKDMQ